MPVLAVFLAACASDVAAPPPRVAPTIGATAVVANTHNALSVTVSVRVRDADSAGVRFHLDGASEAGSVTPAVQTAGDSAVIPVLGLLPARRYTLSAVAYGGGGSVVGDAVQFTTDTLPSDLPRYSASGTDPSPGYVVFSAGAYALAIDNTGRVVWYRRFPNGAGLAFMAEPSGRYVVRPPTPDLGDVEPWLELDPLGNVTRAMACARGLQPRLHDVIGEPDGSYWLMCDETRTMDLSATGGRVSAVVTGTAVQHVSAAGTLLFHWSPFDHFEITDLNAADRSGPSVNWTHGNAIELDTDRNLIVSFRNLGEITKIHSGTGAVLWRMGGRRNQFTFLDSPSPAFARQHGVRVSAPGTLILMDNVGNPNESRAERYIVDEVARTARLAHSYGSVPGALTLIGGSVQSLPGGRTLVSFGTAGRVEEYNAAGQVLWRINGEPGYVFRAQRILSLYAPGLGTAR
ncbi:MAG TPA: arylsulfotransferase family protein [Gemmatimonadaceae bacterium]|nr:arylsulfotransferase family protein [Gemmatimonadaceae bacterium]